MGNIIRNYLSAWNLFRHFISNRIYAGVDENHRTYITALLSANISYKWKD